jgi:spermidine synthase
VSRRRSTVLGRLGDVLVKSDPDNPDGRVMLIDGIEASYVDLADPTFLDFSYVRRIGDVIDVAWPERAPITAAHLGGAGATLPRYVKATRPRSRQVVFEVSADVIELSRAHLGLRSSAALKISQQDARLGLLRLGDASQDLVVGDAFEGARVPESLGSVDAALQIARVLRPGGLYVLNVIDSPPIAYAKAQVSTLRLAFAELAAIADPGVLRGRRTGNVVFVAGQQPLPIEAIGQRARQAPAPERVMDTRACVRFAGGARPLREGSPATPAAAVPEFG